MANTTAHDALAIHGTNPQFLVERVIRTRIYDSTYWKQDCFALNAASLVDKAVELTYVGGTYGALRPSPFLCLVCKLLQLQPDRDIVLEYLAAEDLKYLRALAAMYIRLTFPSLEVYELLEPLLNDYHKLRWRDMTGQYSLSYMDEFIDQLLTEERVCDLILPRLTKRAVLERKEGLRPRTSKLENAMVLGEANGLDDDANDSDDSIRAIRSERQHRIAQADALRAERQALTARARGDMDEYESQQSESDEERLHARILRSRTPSVSPDRTPIGASSRSPSPAFRSRSPSRSPEP
ncbi:Uncharacterized protein MSYG_3776 [Malassezia sympodialis ATCC 42132]|uniref:Pre-mRNA-splicing factor 38 n=1 Tax=Malassezia sympodialis (strain ATCC 42132) TaxID=1230383 RepID=A0A1M8AAR9_MALS4|nr:Uncharacterized protein MSYG_3776 [Malassezia sympodialis ATCC 42132]